MGIKRFKGVKDEGLIENIMFNDPSGAQKNVPVGPVLIPYQTAIGYTTDFTVPRHVYGLNLAVFNNTTQLHTITFGDASVTPLGPGVTNTTGSVGIPCLPGQWTYVSAGEFTHAVTSHANVYVFVIKDE